MNPYNGEQEKRNGSVTHKQLRTEITQIRIKLLTLTSIFSKNSVDLSCSVSAGAVFAFPEDEMSSHSVSFFCKMIQVFSESIKEERRLGHEAYITIRKGRILQIAGG